MKFLACFGICLHLALVETPACTTFFINHDGQRVFGRNYDWITGNGMVYTNHRGLYKTSARTRDGETTSWTSLYGSFTFNQYGKEFPTGGMNEKGLVVELMWLDDTRYPDPDHRPSLGVLQWIQYQLDNCSNIYEVIATDQKIRIASRGTTPIHYLVADGEGGVATIEFLGGKMVVHRDKELPFPVLTNSTYAGSLEQAGLQKHSSVNRNRVFTDNSINRFATACRMLTRYGAMHRETAPVDYAFSILDSVSQGAHTKWSIVYDLVNKKIFFKTRDVRSTRFFPFSAFNLDCRQPARAFDMNQPGQGDISHAFLSYTTERNQELVETSFRESAGQLNVSDESIRKTWLYPASTECRGK